MAPIDNPEHFSRRGVGALSSSDDRSCPTGRDKNMLDCGELMAILLEKAFAWMDTGWDSPTVRRVALDLIAEGLVNQSKVSEVIKDALTQLTIKFDAQIAQVIEKSLLQIMKNCEQNDHLAFLREEPKSATDGMWT